MRKTVSIEKPCHEDWSKMNPTQKGAFCAKCQVDVVDFSQKSNEEIKEILNLNAGKSMCGRFKKTQLVELNTDYSTWRNQSYRTFQSKFLYACLVVFGLTLFTSCIEDEEIMGDIAPIEEHLDSSETENTIHIKGDIKAETHLMGDTIYYPFETIPPKVQHLDPINELPDIELFEMGDVDYIPEEEKGFYEDPFALESEEIDSSTVVPSPSSEETEDLKGSIFSKNFSLSVFPNPTAEIGNVVLNIPEEDYFTIQLFDLSGRFLSEIYSGKLSPSQKAFNIDLSPYSSSVFILKVSSAGHTETVKVQKVS